MPKLGMQPIRKAQIVESTMNCISTIGVHRSSMGKIAEDAGMTSSLLVHYFENRTKLFEGVYRHIYQLMNEEVRWRVSEAGTPLDKVRAICDAQTCDAMLERRIVVTWVALFALVPEIPELARLDRIYARRIRSNFIYHLCEGGLSRSAAVRTADELPPMIDGLWLRKASEPDRDSEALRAVVRNYLSHTLG